MVPFSGTYHAIGATFYTPNCLLIFAKNIVSKLITTYASPHVMLQYSRIAADNICDLCKKFSLYVL